MSRSTAGRIGVWGASGSGKSSYVKQNIKSLKRLVIFDPLEEYGRLADMVKCKTVDQVRAAMAKNWQGFRIAYVPPSGKEPRALSQLCNLLMTAQKTFKQSDGRTGSLVTLVIEEMNLAFPVHGGEAKSRGFAEVCSRGRHYGIEVFGISQRIAEVSTRFRGNCTETVLLRQKGAVDIQAAANSTGAPKAKITGLKNLEYLHEKNGQITAGQIKFKKSKKS